MSADADFIRTHIFRPMADLPDYCKCGYGRDNVRVHGLSDERVDELLPRLDAITRTHDAESGLLLSYDVCADELRTAIRQWFTELS